MPPNCKFEVDDVESEWTHAPFDFIHSRAMGGSISDYGRLYKQAYDHLQPGGWIEVQEFEAWVRSDTPGMMEKATCISEWQKIVDDTTAKIGKRLRVAADQKQHLIDAGFQDVTEDVYKVSRQRLPTTRAERARSTAPDRRLAQRPATQGTRTI